MKTHFESKSSKTEEKVLPFNNHFIDGEDYYNFFKMKENKITYKPDSIFGTLKYIISIACLPYGTLKNTKGEINEISGTGIKPANILYFFLFFFFFWKFLELCIGYRSKTKIHGVQGTLNFSLLICITFFILLYIIVSVFPIIFTINYDNFYKEFTFTTTNDDSPQDYKLNKDSAEDTGKQPVTDNNNNQLLDIAGSNANHDLQSWILASDEKQPDGVRLNDINIGFDFKKE